MLPRGTLLNTATVALGGAVGWAVGTHVPPTYQQIVMSGLGIVTVGVGLKMLIAVRNILIIAAAIAFGGMLGLAIGIDASFHQLAAWIQSFIGGDAASFISVMVATSVLFCVGPMTLLGCMQDRLENKIELLALKSTMDGVGAIFFAVKSGPAVMATAVVVLIFQSLLTFAAKPLAPISADPELLGELSATGGVMLVATGLGLLEIKSLPVANYLPALILAPLFVLLGRRWKRRHA